MNNTIHRNIISYTNCDIENVVLDHASGHSNILKLKEGNN